MFAGFAVLYGFCETMNGNWSQLDMTQELGATTTQASLALTAFWGMVTVGRIAFAAIPSGRAPHVRTLTIGVLGTAALAGLAVLTGPAFALVAVAIVTGSIRGAFTLLQARHHH